MLNDDAKLNKFFIFTTEICIRHANESLNKFERVQQNLNTFVSIDYSYIDSFTKLVIMILKSYVDPHNGEMLDKILETIVIVLTKEHELNKKNFN